MARVRAVERWMRWYGWTNNGGPGAVKLDANKQVIARHGDPTWNDDVDKAIAADEKLMDEEEKMDCYQYGKR